MSDDGNNNNNNNNSKQKNYILLPECKVFVYLNVVNERGHVKHRNKYVHYFLWFCLNYWTPSITACLNSASEDGTACCRVCFILNTSSTIYKEQKCKDGIGYKGQKCTIYWVPFIGYVNVSLYQCTIYSVNVRYSVNVQMYHLYGTKNRNAIDTLYKSEDVSPKIPITDTVEVKGQEFPGRESTTPVRGINYQLLVVKLLK